MTQGACLCGSVRYEFTSALESMLHCHCSMCRKHHGAAFATFVSSRPGAFRWLGGQDSLGSYDSSPGSKRFFCRICGSVAPIVLEKDQGAVAPAGNLEGDPGIRPTMHMFVASKAPWYTICDAVPQFDAYPPGVDAPPIDRPNVEPKPGLTLGSCLCGDVAFAIQGAPSILRNCHCSRCRRARSAAHATNAFYREDQFQWIRGQSLAQTYKLPEALRFAVAFCKRCGSSLPFHARERGIFIVPAGSLDTDPGSPVQAHIYVGSKAPWFEISDALPQFAEGPPLR